MSIAHLLALVALFVQCCLGHTVLLGPYEEVCFHEDLKQDDVLAVSFQVSERGGSGAGASNDIDFTLLSPSHAVVKSSPGIESDDVVLPIKEAGRYMYCFSNKRSSASNKEVLFNVHGILYVDGTDSDDPLDKETTKLERAVQQIKDEQEYMIAREWMHRNTAESTNDRIKWWSLFQLGVVAGTMLFQVYYLRRFFEIKTVV